jgi:exosortase/archaeosortase family protein
MTDASTQAIPFSGSPARRRSWFWPAAAAGLGVAFMAFNGVVRNVEAVFTAHLLGWLSGQPMWVQYSNHAAYWSSNHTQVGGVEVTAECSSAFLIGALLLVGAVLLRSHRFSQGRVGVALAVSCSVLFVLNLTRLLLIGWASGRWGYNGYNWSHTAAGSILVIVTVVAAAAVLVVMLLHQGERHRKL